MWIWKTCVSLSACLCAWVKGMVGEGETREKLKAMKLVNRLSVSGVYNDFSVEWKSLLSVDLFHTKALVNTRSSFSNIQSIFFSNFCQLRRMPSRHEWMKHPLVISQIVCLYVDLLNFIWYFSLIFEINVIVSLGKPF